VILRFLHGWALDAGLWARLLPLLPEFDCRTDDRGYFGQPSEIGQGEIAVGHSFGAMRALAAPHGMRALVAINGFDCFAAREAFLGVPSRVVARMEARFASAPDAVTADFRARCGLAHTPPVTCGAVLQGDLAALREADLRGRWSGPVTLLHAADDPVVPPPMQAAVFAGAHRITIPTGGHLLPLTDPEACAAAIRQTAQALA